MRRGHAGQCRVVELRAADVAVDTLEQANKVLAVGALDRLAVIGAGPPGPGDRQGRIDPRDVQDRFRLEVEHCRILAEVRDLDHAPAPCAVVDQERLIPLAAEVDRASLDAEQPSSDLRNLTGDEPRRRRLEHVHGTSP